MNSRRREAIEGGAEGAPLSSRRREAIEGGAGGAPLSSRGREAIEGGAGGAPLSSRRRNAIEGGAGGAPLRGSFKRGFRNRNPLVLVAALAVLVPALLGLEHFFVSGAWSSVPLKYWMRKASDDYTYVSWTVGKARRTPPSRPAIYLLGGSTAREAITSGAGLSREISADGGPTTVAWDLGSINQNFAQSLAVTDNVPAEGAWVLVGVNLGRFTPDRGSSFEQAEGREFLLKSRFLQQYVAKQYGKYRYTTTILSGIFAYLTSYFRQHDGELLSGEIPSRRYGQHRYNNKSAHTVPQKERMVKIWNTRRYPVFKRNLRFNLAMLEQLLIRAQERGVHVVLVELPNNRALIGDRFDYAVRQYRGPVAALAAEYEVPYLDFNAGLKLRNEDFHDLSHLNESGRVRWQGALAKELARLMPAGGAESSP